MASPVRQYTDELHEAFGYWATWLPGTPLRLGDCGTVADRVFHPEASLDSFGIEAEAIEDRSPGDLQYASRGAVDFRVQLSGGSQTIPHVPVGKAGLEIGFSRENAVVFVAKGTREDRIANVHELRAALLERVSDGDFPPEYAVVTHLVEASAATILIASSQGATFLVSAEADLQAGLIDLANVKANVSLVASRDLHTEILASRRITPLFKLVGFKKGGVFRGSPRFEKLRFEDEGEPGDLSELTPSDADPTT